MNPNNTIISNTKRDMIMVRPYDIAARRTIFKPALRLARIYFLLAQPISCSVTRHHSISFRDDLTIWNMIHHCMNNAHMLFLVKGIIIGNHNLG